MSERRATRIGMEEMLSRSVQIERSALAVSMKSDRPASQNVPARNFALDHHLEVAGRSGAAIRLFEKLVSYTRRQQIYQPGRMLRLHNQKLRLRIPPRQ